jgi:hypothetical protein
VSVLPTLYLRSCGGCAVDLLAEDPTTRTVYCKRCKPKHIKPFDEWAASVQPGRLVYLKPYAAWQGLSRSQYLVVERDGDTLTVQVLGLPESRMTVNIRHTGQHDMTRRSHTGAL